MRKALVLLFVLLPLAAFGQSVSVWDGAGANLGADIDTQAGTASYTGSWTASADIWDGYPDIHKGYLYTLYEASETEQLFTSPYP
ncbi:MAG: hypothetical protein JW820_15215, partial [Spirochaetales bacterium]|nr:hypothetical protein [Spirochaetales bacterium]